MSQDVIKTSYIPKVNHHHHHHHRSHHQTTKVERSTTGRLSISGQEIWALGHTTTLRTKMVPLCWRDFNFNRSQGHSTAEAHPHARISWNFLYFADINFWIFLSKLLFPLPRGREESRRENSKCRSPAVSSWVYGKNRRKASAAWTWWTKEKHCTRNRKGLYISQRA